MAAQRAASFERISLSPQVVAQLSGEEIAMLPMEIRLTLPEVAAWKTPPRIEMTPVPGEQVITIRSTPCKERGHSMHITEHVSSDDGVRTATIIAGFAATILVGWCAGYFLL